MNIKIKTLFGIMILVLTLFFVSNVNAVSFLSEPTVCCERTNNNGYCINTAKENCDNGYHISSTSCESTSYCKKGTCYDSLEGICVENTPKLVCDDEGGMWDERSINELPQCQLGCCIISDQAAFVSLVRAKRLSTLYGVEMDYRTDVNNELECIALAQAQDVGACIFEKDFIKTCEFTTRGDCNEMDFYKNYLCSNEELNTECARQVSTNCYQGKVYWYDSCGNKENVYSSNMEISWNNGKVIEPENICQKNQGDDAEYEKGILGINKPIYGDYYCRKNICIDDEGNERKNGESWCVYDGNVGNGKDRIGSRHFRYNCVNGEIHIEPCADFRNEVCYSEIVETIEGDYSNAGCRINRWQDCTQQTDKDSCENFDKRDCRWLTGVSIRGDVCLPKYAPGFKFWEGGDAQKICTQGNIQCIVSTEKDVFGGAHDKVNEECLTEEWAIQMNQYCSGLGDCGGFVNYKGHYTCDGFKWKIDNIKQEVSNIFKNKFT